MYKVLIIDDEHLSRQLIRSFLGAYPQMQVVGECADGFEGFKAIQELKPDLLFLDIQMPKLNGFEMLELLEEQPQVIFITAFDEYALKAFEASAIDYLLKPVTRPRFDKAVQKWLGQVPNSPEPAKTVTVPADPRPAEGYQHRIVVKDNGRIRIIPEQDIYYIEADDDYIRIVTHDGAFLKKSTLGATELLLDPAVFVRVHRSYLVPVGQLSKIEPYEKDGHIALLHCGAKVQVSKTGMARLKGMLGW